MQSKNAPCKHPVPFHLARAPFHRKALHISPLDKLWAHLTKGCRISVDPFGISGSNATHTNCLIPSVIADHHDEPLKFLEHLSEVELRADVILLAAPRDPSEAKEYYTSAGRPLPRRVAQTAGAWTAEKVCAQQILAENGIVISIGSNTSGMGAKRGFVPIIIIAVQHTPGERDTLCLIECRESEVENVIRHARCDGIDFDAFIQPRRYLNRFCLPNRDTLRVRAIADLVQSYLRADAVSVDPFARNCTLCTLTNDLDPHTQAQYHFGALEFLEYLHVEGFKADLILFDPPYNMRQAIECYSANGYVPPCDNEIQSGWPREIAAAERLLSDTGIFIWCGWNSLAMGPERDFTPIELLHVRHGRGKYDTTVLVECRSSSFCEVISEYPHLSAHLGRNTEITIGLSNESPKPTTP